MILLHSAILIGRSSRLITPQSMLASVVSERDTRNSQRPTSPIRPVPIVLRPIIEPHVQPCDARARRAQPDRLLAQSPGHGVADAFPERMLLLFGRLPN